MSQKPLKTGLAWTAGISTCLLTLLAAVAATTSTNDRELKLTILHTNDLHAHDEEFSESGHQIGGFARVGHEIKYLKAKAPDHTVTIDAGDIFQGTPLFSKYKGEVEVSMLNKMGYDIYTIGNHEFDEGPQNLATQLQKAKFDVINCNMDLSEEPELAAAVKPSVVKTFDGQKVGFIGGITPDLCSVSLSTGKIKIKSAGSDWIKPIADEVHRLKNAGVDKIVLVTHIGVEGDKLIGQQVSDVDVIIGGHSHTRLDKPIVITHADGTSTTIVQTGCYGRTLGELNVTFDKNGKVIDADTQYRLINMTAKIPEDPTLKAYVDEKVKPLLPLRHMVLSQAKGDFDNFFRNHTWDSALGDLITDAIYEEGRENGTQIAFENRGGMRARIDKGPLTEETVQEILPFDNRVTFATIDGACLLKVLEHSVGAGLGGRFLDVHGLKFAYDYGKPVGSRIIFALAQEPDGTWAPVKMDGHFKIAINDYSFKGGEGFDFSTATDKEFTPDKMSVALEHYLAHHKAVTPQKPSRIIGLTGDLATLSNGEGEYVVTIKAAPANYQAILVSGTGEGVETINDGTPVPLTGALIVGEAKVDEQGAAKLHVAKTKLDAKATNLCVVVRPAKRPTSETASKKTLISYPLDLK